MSWHSSHGSGDDRPPESAHSVAWAALFFSLVACAMSGYVFMKTSGVSDSMKKLKENIKLVGEEAGKVIKSATDDSTKSGETTSEKKEGETAKPSADAKEGVNWTKIQDKLKNLRTLLSQGDDRASSYLDSIKKELATLKEYAGEKGAETITKTIMKLDDTRDKMKSDTIGAAERVKELSESLDTKGDDAPHPTPTPTPKS